MSKWMEDKEAISAVEALSRVLRVQWKGRKGGFTPKKEDQARLCPLQGLRISAIGTN